MTNEVVYIEDPLGHMISLTKEICHKDIEGINALDLYDDLSSVIKNPAFLIEKNSGLKKMYYFRPIGWQLSILIKVNYTKEGWEAYQCILNPSDAYIVELLQKGKQII